MSNEGEAFALVINKGIETLLNYVDSKLEPFYAGMVKKVNSGNMEENNKDSSEFVKETRSFLNNHVSVIRSLISEVYFIFYLNKLAELINSKFMNSIYKFKKFNDNTLVKIIFHYKKNESFFPHNKKKA